MSEKFKLSPPWIEFFREVEALFANDPQVIVQYKEDIDTIEIYVKDNPSKAEALMYILPLKKTFGSKSVYINVIPDNADLREDKSSMFKKAFEGNPAFEYMIDIEDVFTNPIHYCVFKKEVVQYWNDDLSDPHGKVSTLYQNIAKDIFGNTGGVIFCTNDK